MNISCYHLSRNLLLTRVGLCCFTNRVHVYRRLLMSDNQGHNHFSPSWVCIGECDTGTSSPPPPTLIPFAPLSIIPQLMSVTFNPINTKAIQSYNYPTSFLSRACLFYQYLWRHRTTEWCRNQLRCLVIRGLDKTYQITVSKDAYSVEQFVATLPYMPEGRGFDSPWDREFYWFNHYGRTMTVGSTQRLTEMSTKGISWSVIAAVA